MELLNKKMKRPFQKRDIKSNISMVENEGKRTINGFIPYNSRSVYMGFYEEITPTAFNKTLRDGADVKALFDHDSSKLLGRVKNQSLRLESRDDGLYIECDLPETSYANDAYILIRDGYCNTMSFGFEIINEDYAIENGREVHYLREVKLEEVSFGVTFPAYEGTNSMARNIRNINLESLSNTLEKEEFTEEDLTFIQDTIDQLKALLPSTPDESTEESQTEEPVEESTDTEVVDNTSATEEDEQFMERIMDELKSILGDTTNG